LFPVLLRDLPNVTLHEIDPPSTIEIGGLTIQADLVTHPGPTLGYRLECPHGALAYLPDHEPALGVMEFPDLADWTSGYGLAEGADVLIHDAQYTGDEYKGRLGWGHSTLEQALAFAGLAGVKQLVTFHYDPAHSDEMLDGVMEGIGKSRDLPFDLTPGRFGLTLDIGQKGSPASSG
jgi:ribonuclease BN (tRNA processing enzyme)